MKFTDYSPPRRPRRAVHAPPVEFAVGMRLSLTSECVGRRHVVLVGGHRRLLRPSCFEMLAEFVAAKKLTESGYLHQSDCCTTAESPEYFAKLAGRVRQDMGSLEFLEVGPKSYRLRFRPEEIDVCRGVIELRELSDAVVAKLQAVLSLRANCQ